MKISQVFPVLFFTLLFLNIACSREDYTEPYISDKPGHARFTIASKNEIVPILYSAEDFSGVGRAVTNLVSDLEKISGKAPLLLKDSLIQSDQIILIGTIGKNPLIDRLVRENKLDLKAIEGKWEASVKQVVRNPFPGVKKALVICGSDKRGTIYGIYDLSEKAGVSPWYWWADVPVPENTEIYVCRDTELLNEPAVKYRGIFINDEAPALSGWAEEKFGGFNHLFYENVFELILRMKGNYLWPAMWGRAFYDDDSLNAVLADDYGVVIGTSHHEPLMRAHDEWRRYGNGPWNYMKNKETLQTFWREGIERMGSNESIITIGMRGDGDEPMTEGTAIELLERIVADQRGIISSVTGMESSASPQLWALYKEVQDYYDKGMRVPEDVTLLLCDDNWGNIRKLPKTEDRDSKGGFGVYYHFDYVGDPRNYKWLNTNQIERTWEQMTRAYTLGVDRIWIVNVGDIKPMELPIQFFLDLAWDPSAINAGHLPSYYEKWAAQQFGTEYAPEIGRIISTCTKYNSRRKPELLSPATYSILNYREAESVSDDFQKLAEQSRTIEELLPEASKAAYFQLVAFPVEACSNLNELYYVTGLNTMYASQGRALTNKLAIEAGKLYEKDSLLTEEYHSLLDGKWRHMMSQTHIGYTYWQQPENNSMPEVATIALEEKSSMGLAIEGSAEVWPGSEPDPVLPGFDRYGEDTRRIDVFNRSGSPFSYTAVADAEWIRISGFTGNVSLQERLEIQIDWDKCPEGKQKGSITLSGPEVEALIVHLHADNRPIPSSLEKGTFAEGDGYISIEAVHFSKAVNQGQITWTEVPNLGRTASSMITLPMDLGVTEPGGDSPYLEYNIYLQDTGLMKLDCYCSPTLDFTETGELRYGISIDNGPVTLVNILENESQPLWRKWVADNINITSSLHMIGEPGKHTVRFWLVDPGVVLQKIVLVTKEPLPPSYLGPPESRKL